MKTIKQRIERGRYEVKVGAVTAIIEHKADKGGPWFVYIDGVVVQHHDTLWQCVEWVERTAEKRAAMLQDAADHERELLNDPEQRSIPDVVDPTPEDIRAGELLNHMYTAVDAVRENGTNELLTSVLGLNVLDAVNRYNQHCRGGPYFFYDDVAREVYHLC